MIRIDITREKIIPELLATSLEDDSCGGFVYFEGRVRKHNEGKSVLRLRYECYEPMAIQVLNALSAEASQRWGVKGIHLVHRIGEIPIGEIALWMGVAASHRRPAFEACQFLIEELKRKAPIWKHESYADGSQEWIACHHA